MYLLSYLKGISKSMLFNSILNLLYIISFRCEKFNYLALTGGGGSDQFTTSEKFAPPLGPQYSEPCAPPLIFKTFLRLCLWATMRKYNVNANLVSAIEHLYDKAISAVQINGSTGEGFRKTVGVRQGCLFLSTLFNILSQKDYV